jgi:hypothetical protein
LARHGTYERKKPAGTQVARWYCPEGQPFKGDNSMNHNELIFTQRSVAITQ